MAHKIENLAVVALHGDRITDASVQCLGATLLRGAGGIRLQAEFLDAGVRLDAVEILLVAGAFGYHLRPDSLAGGGLLPASLAAKVEAVGNTCKAGAVTLLTNDGTRRELEAVAARVHSIELANDAAFGRRFVEQMAFGDA